MSGDQCDEIDNDVSADAKNGLDDGIALKKSRRKQTFERRNIKEVRDDSLNEEARAAQLAELERRKRLGIDNSDPTRFSNIEFLLNDVTAEHCLNFSSEGLGDSVSTVDDGDRVPSKRAKVKLLDTETDLETVRSNIKREYDINVGSRESSNGTVTTVTDRFDSSRHEEKAFTPTGSASASLFGCTWSGSYSSHLGQSRDDAILLGDSDDDLEKPTDSVVIELSDGEADLNEPEYETEICELQDAANLADEHGRVVINPNRDVSTEPEIVLPPQIAKVIKPHQVSGIRFLYDNLIESLSRFETTGGFGCILAHSMGLGKTIQIIAFLDIIFRYCNAKRVLAIVPINTIQNWQAEFEIWSPPISKQSGAVHPKASEHAVSDASHSSQLNEFVDGSSKVAPSSSAESCNLTVTQAHGDDAQRNCAPGGQLECLSRAFKLFVVRDVIKTMTQRHQIIRQWYEEGGVLLLGYEMFRLLLNQKRMLAGTSLTKAEMRSMSRRKNKLICVDLEREEKREKMWSDFHAALLDPGPQLVICDEGHRIKNSEASISKALKAIRTRRRVVLTGYPLQNNLMEYWCMVDFVRPNYLGTKQEFTNMFQRPIENGQCIDSTSTDRKVMQGRAHVLHDLLSGFVQRRSHAVLKATLPAKTEIVLLIKLSPLQRTLYAAFMRSLNSSGPSGWAQVNTLKTYAMCCKIWNHPDILWRAMEEHKEAMDFDIDDPSSGSCGGRGPRQNAANLRLTNFQPNSSLIASPKMTAVENPFLRSNESLNGSIYSNAQSLCTPFYSYPSLPTQVGFVNTQRSSGVMYNQTSQTALHSSASSQAAVGAYDWACCPELWGSHFKPGNVDHSGKIILFLSLLEGCVLAGDKILVFTQSLYTLDLLERILRRLPLPEPANVGTNRHPLLEVQRESSVPNGPPSDSIVDCNHDPSVPSSDLFDIRNTSCHLTASSPSIASANGGHLDSESVPREETIAAAANALFTLHEELNASSESQRRTEGTHDFTLPVDDIHVTVKSEPPAVETPLDLQVMDQEETLRSLHYRLASHLGAPDHPTVWTKNVHYFRLDGSTTASEREKLINHFNDPKNPAKLFLVSTRAGCLGVNLIGANRVVVFDASWNPCHDCQAVCRVYRYGQRKPCYIYRLVSDNTMEKKIYDRQVTKQGMSDRVVDELNPTQQFTRSQVELLMSFEDKDMPTLTDNDLDSCRGLIEPDPILASVLRKHKSWITKIPFTHESLLIDRKDYRLTRVEKRLAKQRYEQEKRLSLSYQQAHLFQFQRMQALQQQQLIAAGINPALVDQSPFFDRLPHFLSRGLSYRPTYTSGMAALDAMRQVQREANVETDSLRRRGIYDASSRNPDCKVTRVVATADLHFPSTTENKTTQRLIPKGEVLEVIQTPKGKYLRIVRTGDLFVVKTSTSSASSAATNSESSHAPPSCASNTVEPTPAVCTSNADAQYKAGGALVATPPSSGASVNDPSPFPNELSSTAGCATTSPSSNCSHSVLYEGSSAKKTVAQMEGQPLGLPHPQWSNATNRSTVSNTITNESFPTPSPSILRSASEPQQHPGCTQLYSDFNHIGESNLRSSASLTPSHTSPPDRFGLPHHSLPPTSPTKTNNPPRPDTFSFEQQQQHLYDTHLAQRRLSQPPVPPWSCSNCGQSSLLGCTCASSRPDQSIVRTTAQQSTSSTSYNQKMPMSSFESSSCSPEAAVHKQGTGFPQVPQYESSGTEGQFYRLADSQQQQQQEQYMRAAQEVARQSAAAAAYLSFNKHQLGSSGAPHHMKQSHDPEAPTNSNKLASPHLSAHHHSPTGPPSSTANQSARFGGPPSQTPASVMQDYFAQLAGQHAPQTSFFPAQHAVNLTHSHSMAAAMQQYFSANITSPPMLASTEGMSGTSIYPGLAPLHTASGNSGLLQTPREPVSQHVSLDQHTAQGQRRLPFITQSSQAAPFDRLQPHRLLPNFRFP
ncbi:unnamed protein product [Dicrocoelium dendriticum]|nr:unnamed protein product [Dicrocoelium dendriticum]